MGQKRKRQKNQVNQNNTRNATNKNFTSAMCDTYFTSDWSGALKPVGEADIVYAQHRGLCQVY